MRFVLLTVCAAALVACSEMKAPTDLVSTGKATPTGKNGPAGKTAPALPHDLQPRSRVAKMDARPVTVQLEELVTSRFAKVALPADPFSQSPDAVHPDIACPSNWNGARCWLLYTPYRNSDPSYENPAFLMAGSDTAWTTPPDVHNPIIGYPGLGQYNSDPDHAFDPGTGRLVQVYRVVSATSNNIMIMSTATAKQWSQPVLAFAEPNHDAVSPSLIIESDRTGKMWYVRAGPAGCTAQSSKVLLRTAQPALLTYFENAQWSAPTPVDMSIPGYTIWHMDVDELPAGGYLAFIAAFPVGTTCSNSDLWLATSPDGITWRNFAIPLLWRGMAIARNRSISTWYRGTIRYDIDGDTLHLWPSALSGRSWNVYHVALPLEQTVELLGMAKPSDMRALRRRAPKPAATVIPMP